MQSWVSLRFQRVQISSKYFENREFAVLDACEFTHSAQPNLRAKIEFT